MANELRIRHIFDHVARLKKLIPSWLRGKPVISALLTTLGEEASQQLEEDVFGAYTGEMVSLASGVRLDEWGLLFGVRRQGLDDTWYRKLIYGAALARNMAGDEDSYIRTYQALTSPSIVEFALAPPRCVVLTAFRDEYMPVEYARRAGDLMRSVSTTGAIVLMETTDTYLGCVGRTRAPTATPFGAGIPVRLV